MSSEFDRIFNNSTEKDLQFIKETFPTDLFKGILQRVDDFLKPIYDDIAELQKAHLHASQASAKENGFAPSAAKTRRTTRKRSQRSALKESTQQNADVTLTNVQVKIERLSIPPGSDTVADNVKQTMIAESDEPTDDCDEKEDEDTRSTRSGTRRRVMRTAEVRNRSPNKEPNEQQDLQDNCEETNPNTTFVASSPINTEIEKKQTTLNSFQRVDEFIKPSSDDIDDEPRKTFLSSWEPTVQENEGAPQAENTRNTTRTRSQKNALKESAQQNADNTLTNVRVKVEELSSHAASDTSVDGVMQTIKTEAEELTTDCGTEQEEEDTRSTRSGTRRRRRVVKTLDKQNRSPSKESNEKQDLQGSSDETNSNKTFVANSTINRQTVVVESPVLLKNIERTKNFTPRLTRNKSRAMKKQENETTDFKKLTESQTQTQNTSTVQGKAKSTPKPQFKAALSHTQNSAPKHKLKNTTAGKSASAIKSSQVEFMEREKVRREKEEEARRKRDAQIQMQIELKKKKNEEKQLKAQQQREALEKERQKGLEAQLVREEEKRKQALAEQEEKKQKIREEIERKRHQVKLRAIEEKKQEQARVMEEKKMVDMLANKDKEMMKQAQALKQTDQAEINRQDQIPIYLREPTPHLPLSDCFDSDEDEFFEARSCPSWASQNRLDELQQQAIGAGEHLKNTFFFRQAETADLKEIFEVIDPEKLRRNSSAVWRKPPRYTLFIAPFDEQEDENVL